MTMGSVQLGAGSLLSRHFDVSGWAQLDLGQTDHGLATKTVTGGFTLLWVAGRFRLGGGADLAWFGITRITTGGLLWQLGTGLGADASFDVIKTRSVSVFVAAHGEADVLFNSSTLISTALLSATGKAGFRF
jgi:hypothetical protein